LFIDLTLIAHKIQIRNNQNEYNTTQNENKNSIKSLIMSLLNTSSFLRSVTRRYVATSSSSASSTLSSSSSSRTFGSTTSTSISEKEVQGLFSLWNDALATLDSDKVAKRYSKNALLLPTVSDIPRNDYDSIKDYFDNFLKSKPQGEILESYVQIGECGNYAQDNGLYEFTLGASGAKVKGRYTFSYIKEGDEWKISHHHSSQMPEEIMPKGQSISSEETRKLFDLWNNALATLDPKQVAARYSKNAILLPTVSDEARTTPEGILDYFTNFLKSKPQGVIISGVTIADTPNWCKDAGIYEFTMGATGDVVAGRYTFVYVYEDGEWKIAHHHSSVMPEKLMADGAKLAEIEAAK
jgi:uncharacterized protein (TIGR02246 family)